MKTKQKPFSEQLREAREKLGINQTEAAQLLEVSMEAVSKWERDICAPFKITQEGALARLAIAKPRANGHAEPKKKIRK